MADLGTFIVESDTRTAGQLKPEEAALYECLQLTGRDISAYLVDGDFSFASMEKKLTHDGQGGSSLDLAQATSAWIRTKSKRVPLSFSPPLRAAPLARGCQVSRGSDRAFLAGRRPSRRPRCTSHCWSARASAPRSRPPGSPTPSCQSCEASCGCPACASTSALLASDASCECCALLCQVRRPRPSQRACRLQFGTIHLTFCMILCRGACEGGPPGSLGQGGLAHPSRARGPCAGAGVGRHRLHHRKVAPPLCGPLPWPDLHPGQQGLPLAACNTERLH